MATFSTISDTSDIECAICLEVWQDPVELLPCRHIFCKSCVERLQRRKCPDCRRDFTGTQKPNRILVNMAKEVRVRCDNCGWEGTREASANHVCPRKQQSRNEPVFQAWTPPTREEMMQAAGYSHHQGGSSSGGGQSSGPQLKQGWNEAVDRSSGRTYYVNHMTRQTTWTPPIDPATMSNPATGPLPQGWEQKVDPNTNMVYYVDHVNKRTSWVRPTA